jgi:hypothetical protein
MEKQHLLELDYGFAMSVKSLIQALGMQAENQIRADQGNSPAYSEKDFLKIIDENGIHHNSILSRWKE